MYKKDQNMKQTETKPKKDWIFLKKLYTKIDRTTFRPKKNFKHSKNVDVPEDEELQANDGEYPARKDHLVEQPHLYIVIIKVFRYRDFFIEIFYHDNHPKYLGLM